MYYKRSRDDDDDDDFDDRPRSNRAKADFRPYSTTAEASGLYPDSPQRDKYNKSIAWWFGKRIYLGNDTQAGRLFWLLAEKPGIAHSYREMRDVIDGEDTIPASPNEWKKADERFRKALSRLRQRLRESGVDNHVVVVRDGATVTLVFRSQPAPKIERTTTRIDPPTVVPPPVTNRVCHSHSRPDYII